MRAKVSAGVSQRSVEIRYCGCWLNKPCVRYRSRPRLGARPSGQARGQVFVRVNQVLERLWARSIVKSDRMVGGFGLRTSSDRGGSEARKVPLCLARARIARVGMMVPVVC